MTTFPALSDEAQTWDLKIRIQRIFVPVRRHVSQSLKSDLMLPVYLRSGCRKWVKANQAILAPSLARSSKKSGYDFDTDSAPVIVTAPAAPAAITAAIIAIRWSLCEETTAP